MLSEILMDLYKITKDSFTDSYRGNDNRIKNIHEIISKHLTIEQKLACYTEREKQLVQQMKTELDNNDSEKYYNKKELLEMLSIKDNS